MAPWPTEIGWPCQSWRCRRPGRCLPNGQRLAMEVAVGDKIIYSKFAGTEIQVADEELLVLSTNDILAKVS
ncbi:MAG: hypothetical protein J4O03_02125 [Chloroflexi bacterium]|nr:hypothetical protein [Chloroflexota bacterium]MCH8349038.1 hypothetical protein [Chloroflexota bacterium]MCI0779778.1 hypothetical protein [Chloroflexota bacterium]MCI0785625.1 hypothetical protein [Chloroflexota bacterium]MCI0792237.1 hypothetical protein [Chloroflexota bacterium]